MYVLVQRQVPVGDCLQGAQQFPTQTTLYHHTEYVLPMNIKSFHMLGSWEMIKQS